MRTRLLATLLCGFAWTGVVNAQPVSLVEEIKAGTAYRVSSRTSIEGTISVPAQDGQPAKSLKVSGKAAVEYAERILEMKGNSVERSVRYYDRLTFDRDTDGVAYHGELRP